MCKALIRASSESQEIIQQTVAIFVKNEPRKPRLTDHFQVLTESRVHDFIIHDMRSGEEMAASK